MNVARRADGLLSAKQTLALLALIATQASGYAKERALDDLAAMAHVSRSRTYNTITLLVVFGALSTSGSLVRVLLQKSAEEWRMFIADLTAATMARRIEKDGSRCLQTRRHDALWLDSMLLPESYDGLSLWLAEFEVAIRTGTRERFWKVSTRHHATLLGAARAANRTRVRRRVTQLQLEDALAEQAEHGLEAELWVLEYEKRRLTAHPLNDQIRRVSEENVAAGYDIASFFSLTVLHHDMHIEVKSYAGKKRFFWSRNEIDTAAVLAEAYVLYLVDRSRCHEPDYVPEVIRGPYSALFLSDASGWNISPTTFECIAEG